MLYRRSFFDTDESLARELVLWVNNDAQTYRQLEQIQRNMTRKLAQDNFDPELAIQGFMWAAETGAKSYSREFGGVWHENFPIAIRRMAAKMLRDEFLAEVEATPQSFERHVFKKDTSKWRSRYPRDAGVRKAFHGGPNQERVEAAIRNIYNILDGVFEGNAVNEWEDAYNLLNQLDRIISNYGYQLDRDLHRR